MADEQDKLCTCGGREHHEQHCPLAFDYKPPPTEDNRLVTVDAVMVLRTLYGGASPSECPHCGERNPRLGEGPCPHCGRE